MASSSTLKASSSTSNCDGYNYHVFLSFRGEDTRQTFTGHLYANLVARGIHTFRDDEELEKGGDIASDLSRAIEESKIFIIIFSKHYADSKWCLNELVKIIDCMTKEESVVLPVFYHVDPRDVRNQGGSFKDAFLGHAKDADQEKKKTIETWKNALKTAANLSGYHLQNQSEAEFIQSICEDILTRLNRKPLHVGDNIVGMDFHLEQLKSLIKIELDEVHMVGIYGTGGIGKTTISMAIYNDISSQFDGSSFLANVGGKLEDGLLKLQKRLLQDILKCNDCDKPKFSSIGEGINEIKQRLRSKRVLIVLDDVDNYMQLENLAGKYGWYGAKSIIIITTKDKHLLKRHEVNVVYEVQKLNHEKSAELFNWWAFKQNTPLPKFESLSDSIVKYADGLPIALKVLGGFLFKKSTEEWESELQKLQEMPDRTVQSVLKVSYDKLDSREQAVFLDIACFFRGEDKNFVLRILGSDAEIGITVLEERCLITTSENMLDMHDLLQQMGREVVRQEDLKESHKYPQEPGKRSRLWDPKDVESVLTRNTGTEAIEGLFIEVSTPNQIQFSTNCFAKMKNLRLFKVYYEVEDDQDDSDDSDDLDDFEVDLSEDFEIPSFKLRYFHFEGYPLQCLPRNFHAKNLVELDLIRSSIKQLWRENEILDKLKVINLSYSEDLVEIPDFSSVPNLEILILEGCTRLESLPRNFHKLEHLQSLSCSGCSKLKSFPEIKGNMSKLRKLDLGRTPLMEVPSSIEHLNGLEHFNLAFCERLVDLPKSICSLSSLKILDLCGCSNLEGFPKIKDMSKLSELNLKGTPIIDVPSSSEYLNGLEVLSLSLCRKVRNLIESICSLSSLQRLDLSFTDIYELPSSIGCLKVLKYLDLRNCQYLANLPESICNLSSLETLTMVRCLNLWGGFPEIKNDMENLKRLDLRETSIKELPSSIGRLKALQHLDLSSCKSLRSLSESICNLSSLKTLIMEGCSNLKGFPEIKDMKNLERLDLGRTGITELPSSIGRLKALQHLDLSYCESLRSISESFCNLSSLETLNLAWCSNLKSFPEIKDDMENLKTLDLACTDIEELPSSIGHLKALSNLDLFNCESLKSLSESICNLSSLKTLDVRECSKLERVEVNLVGSYDLICCILKQRVIWWRNILPHVEMEGGVLNHPVFSLSSLVESCTRDYRGISGDSFHLSVLEVLSIGNFSPIQRRILSDIFRQSSLESVSLRNCNLMEEGIPSDIWNLSSLENLSLSNCSLTEGEILNHICHLTSLQKLSLDGNNFSSIPANIIQLSKLRTLHLNHCQKLLQIPELPPSLRVLDAHDCPCLETLSRPSSLLGFPLFKCFESAIEEYECGSYWRKEVEILMPRNNGIPEWISHKKKGSEIVVELPENWWEDNNFLGFALCSVFECEEDPSRCDFDFHYFFGFRHFFEFDHPYGFIVEFTFVDALVYSCSYPFCRNCGESNRVWVAYYPKVAIENKHWSNERRHLKASCYCRGVKVEECGLHLIYKTNILNRDSNATNHWPRLLSENTDFNVNRSLDDAENPHNKKSRLL